MYKKMWMISRRPPLERSEIDREEVAGIKRIFTRTLKTLEIRKSQKDYKWK